MKKRNKTLKRKKRVVAYAIVYLDALDAHQIEIQKTKYLNCKKKLIVIQERHHLELQAPARN